MKKIQRRDRGGADRLQSLRLEPGEGHPEFELWKSEWKIAASNLELSNFEMVSSSLEII